MSLNSNARADEAPLTVSSDWFFGTEPQPYAVYYFRFNNNKATSVGIDGDDARAVLDDVSHCLYFFTVYYLRELGYGR